MTVASVSLLQVKNRKSEPQRGPRTYSQETGLCLEALEAETISDCRGAHKKPKSLSHWGVQG